MTTARDALRKATRNYVEAALNLIQSRCVPFAVSGEGRTEWVAQSPQSFYLVTHPRLTWEHWISHNIALLHQLTEHRALLEALCDDPELAALVGGYVGAAGTTVQVEVRNLTDRLVWDCARARFSLDDFDLRFDEWDAQLRAREVELVSLVPLLGFKAPGRVVLDSEITIEPLSDAETCYLLGLGVRLSVFNQGGDRLHWHSAPPFAVRIVRRVPRVLGSPSEPPSNPDPWLGPALRAEAVLTALRLYLGGTLSPSGQATRHTSWPFEGNTHVGQLWEFPVSARHQGLGYELSEQDARLLPAFFASFERAIADGRVAQATRRFAYAADRIRLEDRILDVMIALEGLLLPIKGEKIVSRFVKRGTHLAQTSGLHGSLKKFLNNAYDVRSSVAHGSRIDQNRVRNLAGKKCSLQEFARVLDGVARSMLRAAITHTCEHGAFLDEAGWRQLLRQATRSRLRHRFGRRNRSHFWERAARRQCDFRDM